MQRRRMLAGLTGALVLTPLARRARAAGRLGNGCDLAIDPLFSDGFEPDGLVPDVPAYYLPQ